MKKNLLLIVCLGLLAATILAEEFVVQESAAFSYVYLEKKGSYSQIAATVQSFFAEFFKQGLAPRGPLCAFYYNAPGQVPESELLWRIGMPVAVDARPQAPLKTENFPAATVVYTLRTGPYETVAKTYAALNQFIAQHGYKMTGPAIERYLNDPAKVKPEELKTEILLPVGK